MHRGKKPSSRIRTITAKVGSKVGSYYLHIEHTNGRVIGLSISSPGRYVDSVVGELMSAIGESATAIITEIQVRP